MKALRSHLRRYTFSAGIALGLLFYVYFYAWTFALALGGVLFMILFFKKDWAKLRTLACIFGIGSLIGPFNVLRIFEFLRSSAGLQFSYFSWSSHGRFIMPNTLGLFMLCLYAWFAYRKREDSNTWLIFGLILAGFVALNQQLITGRVVQQNHYYWFFIVPVYIISGMYMLWSLLEGKRWQGVIYVLLGCMVLLNTAVGQYRSFLTTVESKLYEQIYQPVISYLGAIPEKGVVLAADDHLQLLIPIYTEHDLFWTTAGALNDNPEPRFKDALFMYLYLNVESRRDPAGYLERSMEDAGSASFYKHLYMAIEGFASGYDYYHYLKVAHDPIVMGEQRKKLIASLASEYEALIADPVGIPALVSKYGITHLVHDTNRHPEWDPSFLAGTEVVSNRGVHAYRLGNN